MSVGPAEHGFTCTESMLIVSALEIQELLWVQDSVHVQNPYKTASLITYIIESKGWLPVVEAFRTLGSLADVVRTPGGVAFVEVRPAVRLSQKDEPDTGSLREDRAPLGERREAFNSISNNVPVQREMEEGRSADSEYSAPSGRGFSRHRGLPIRCGFWGRARERNSRAPHRLDEPTRLSLGMVASLQSQLPFPLARSL